MAKEGKRKLNSNRFHPSPSNLGPANFLDVAFDRNPAMVWEKKTRVGEGSGWNGEMFEECWGNYLGKLAHGDQFACVFCNSLLVWKLLVGCGAIGGSKAAKYLVATSGNHPRNQRNGLHLPILWWQFLKRQSRVVIYFGKKLRLRPSCFGASCVEEWTPKKVQRTCKAPQKIYTPEV